LILLKRSQHPDQKKAWCPTVKNLKEQHSSISLQTLCVLLGYSPQAYHKHNKKTYQQQCDEGLILHEVDAIRKQQPRCGGRKLFIMLTPFFKQHNIMMGRDKFFDLLKRNKLLIRKTKRNIYIYHYEQTSLLSLSQPGKEFYANEGT
jgi:hypothetical protein